MEFGSEVVERNFTIFHFVPRASCQTPIGRRCFCVVWPFELTLRSISRDANSTKCGLIPSKIQTPLVTLKALEDGGISDVSVL